MGCAMVANAVTLTLTPGTLRDHIAEIPAAETEIVILGEINAKDLSALAGIRQQGATPTVLNLADATIASTRYATGNYLGYTYLPATELPPYIFAQTSFSQIELPNSLTVIGEGAFAGSALAAISIPESVTAIGDFAFYDCKDLVAVSADKKLATLGKGAFSNCVKLKEVNLANSSITQLPERTFAGCSALKTPGLPAALESIGAEAFSGTSLTSVSLGSVKKLEPFALSGMTTLESAAVSSQAQQGEGLFAGDTSLEKISGATHFLPDAYAAGCSSLDPNSLSVNAEAIGQHALAGTMTLGELTLAPTLQSVDNEAFSGLNRLKLINAYSLGSNVPYAAENAFDGIDPSRIKLLVNEDDQPAWKADEQWGKFLITADPNTLADIMATDSAISIRLTGSAIEVTAPVTLENITLYLPDGQVITSLNPYADSCRLEIPDAKAIIVKASAGEDSKAVKFLLK